MLLGIKILATGAVIALFSVFMGWLVADKNDRSQAQKNRLFFLGFLFLVGILTAFAGALVAIWSMQ